jgi:alpha-beta hydrolase superfamily lysophospholipase
MKFLSLLACISIISPPFFALPAFGEEQWQALLNQAEPIYLDSDYKKALPLYVLAVAESKDASLSDRLRCLRYLGDCYCRLNQPDEAMKQYEQVDALLPADDVDEHVASMNDKAVCYELRGDWKKAEALCLAALKLCSDAKEPNLWNLARTQAHLGYIDYMEADYLPAIRYFEQAERTLAESGRKDLPAVMLGQKLAFAQAGSYYHLKRFDDAAKYFQRMYDANVILFGKTDLQTGWAMLAMSDVLEKLNRNHEADDWYRKAIYVFRKYNLDRLAKEFAPQGKDADEVKARIQKAVFGKSIEPTDLQDTQPPMCPDSMSIVNTHDPRTMYARPFTDAPGRVWMNPFREQRGIVIAIHGLSLEHNSFDALARQLADVGFCTIAFDVRGFGTYRQALGAEQVDFDNCLHDLQLVVSTIRNDAPGAPLFVLGESMGGALALQLAADNPKLIDGLIASVPAGKRFKEKATALKVALHYLNDKDRPFNIGTEVINQATTDPKLKEMWASDPNTRSTLSPRELLEFQMMMNRNMQSAKKIDCMPVIIFQGVSDGLVKPESTYDLFRAIATKDKSFVMVGGAEHLIFEEGRFTPPVLKGLIAWIESHIASVRDSETVAK